MYIYNQMIFYVIFWLWDQGFKKNATDGEAHNKIKNDFFNWALSLQKGFFYYYYFWRL